MHRFWTSVVKPLLACLQPATIVEIGSDRGENTRDLLELCRHRRGQAVLHAIDPAPGFEAAAWQQAQPDVFVFHQSLSLEALPCVGAMQAVLIDGDHNWYTVFHELQLIETLAAQNGHAYPLVFLHDVGWPYGRRDLYYDPGKIPASQRQPYRRAGMRMGSPGLHDRGGLNPHMQNALAEGGAHNGVLTAIDEYRAASGLRFRFSQVPGFHGLGLLADGERLAGSPALAAALAQIDAAWPRAGRLRALEQTRLARLILVMGLEAKIGAGGSAAGAARLLARAARWNLKRVTRQVSGELAELYALA